MSVIYALSSGAGRAGVAVIRLSGAGTGDVLSALAGDLPPPRRASLRRLRDRNGETLDEGLAIWFPGPASFTGEDCAELHVHGSKAVIDAIFRALGDQLGCLPAKPGEFSKRAFVNGRLDLVDIESLADLIDSETEGQRRQALSQLGGSLQRHVRSWLESASEAQALVEAELDFSDEGDVEVDLARPAAIALDLALRCRNVLKEAGRVEPMANGFRVAIVGPPNAGKSSLLNRLAGHEAAIVSERPGTTRDVIEVRLDLNGLPIRLADTAGLRDSSDPIEQLGVERALRAAEAADLVMWVSMDQPPPPDWGDPSRSVAVLPVASQRDRFDGSSLPSWAPFGVSSVTGLGIERLVQEVERRAQVSLAVGSQAIMLRERQRRQIESAALHFEQASVVQLPELIAEELQSARNRLAEVLGLRAASDILDDVFGRFCIGK